LGGGCLGEPREPPTGMELELEARARHGLVALLLLGVPGEKIDLDHGLARGSVLTQGKTNGEHQKRCDFVRHQRLQRSFAHGHRGEWIRELHGLFKSLPERFSKAWRA